MRRALGLLFVLILVGGLGVASVLGGWITLPHLDLAGLLSTEKSAPASGEPPSAEAPAAASDAQASNQDRSATITDPRAPGAQPQTAASSSPKIEMARIDPDGASVLAGRAPAGSDVTLYANGEVVATARTSEDGQWSAVLTRRFPPGPLELSVTAAKPTGGSTRGPAVTLTVPKGSGIAELAAAPAMPRPILPPKVPPSEAQAINELATLVERARNSGGNPNDAAKPTVVPVPITFVSGEATMTPQGVHAADLLVEYVRIMAPKAMTLSGHADVRGTDDYNVELSRQRLEAIEHHLRNNGYAGRLSLVPKGKSEPFMGIDRAGATHDAVLQADRRVELRLIE